MCKIDFFLARVCRDFFKRKNCISLQNQLTGNFRRKKPYMTSEPTHEKLPEIIPTDSTEPTHETLPVKEKYCFSVASNQFAALFYNYLASTSGKIDLLVKSH